MPNKVYIKVTKELVGKSNAINILIKNGGRNDYEYSDSRECILYIAESGRIIEAENVEVEERKLIINGYKEIKTNMPNKVYIKVTPQMAGDPNIIATLESEGATNIYGYEAECEGVFYINDKGFIESTTLQSENALINQGYHEIEPQELTHTITLRKGSTPLLLPLKVPEGYEAVIDGKVVTEVEVQIRRKQWKPKMGETYYFVNLGRYYQNVGSFAYIDSITDKQALDNHNVFKTKEEAEQFLEILKQHYWQAVEEYEKKL